MNKFDGVANTLFVPLVARINISKKFPEYFMDEKALVCLRILPAGRAYAAHVREQARETRLRVRKTALYAFLGAFAGGLLGALLAAAVFLVGG